MTARKKAVLRTGIKEKVMTAMLSLAVVLSMGVSVSAEEGREGEWDEFEKGEQKYQYTVNIYAGKEGYFSGTGTSQKSITVDAGSELSIDIRDLVVNDPDQYYARGMKIAGHDNDEISTRNYQSYTWRKNADGTGGLDQDYNFSVAYGIAGGMVKYTVNYVDESGNPLETPEDYYGMIGDKPVVSYKYVEDYRPNAYNQGKTLVEDETQNVFTFTYTKLVQPTPAPSAGTGTGGSGGSGGSGTGGGSGSTGGGSTGGGSTGGTGSTGGAATDSTGANGTENAGEETGSSDRGNNGAAPAGTGNIGAPSGNTGANNGDTGRATEEADNAGAGRQEQAGAPENRDDADASAAGRANESGEEAVNAAGNEEDATGTGTDRAADEEPVEYIDLDDPEVPLAGVNSIEANNQTAEKNETDVVTKEKTDGGLSTGVKTGIGIALAAAVAILVALLNLLRKKPQQDE